MLCAYRVGCCPLQATELFTESLAAMSLDARMTLGYSLADLILDCTFDGQPCDMPRCVYYFFYDKKATHMLRSQLDKAAPESSYPLGDKPVSQPALSQTLVGHSVIVVRHVVLSVTLYRATYRGLPPRRCR